VKTPSTRRAVIDVGTNSVKLLVADVCGGEVSPIFEDSEQTRLGRGFYETQKLQPEPVKATAVAVGNFSSLAGKYEAVSVRVIATSAARDAKNSSDLITAIEHACGLQVEIISGEQEADWAFRGVTADLKLARQPVLIMDVGGGSTEFIVGCGDEKKFSRSYPVGSVRLLEMISPSDPPLAGELAKCRLWLREFFQREVRPELGCFLPQERFFGGVPMTLIGTGGTVGILARMKLRIDDFNREKIEGTVLSHRRVSANVRRLWSLPLQKRKKIRGVPAKRADVMLTGAAIYEAVMGEFGFSKLQVSTRGLRYAALMD